MSDPASAGTGKTDIERLAHYRELAAQFRQWAKNENVSEARDGLLDLARRAYSRESDELLRTLAVSVAVQVDDAEAGAFLLNGLSYVAVIVSLLVGIHNWKRRLR